ncbi:MAG: ABC transporter permease [Kiritimatiellae bacterium]|nr:ABC transporter permease [Kiritimatiellia bacterium]
MNRIQYLLRRLMLLVPTFFGITVVCFMLTRLLPGGPVEMAMARMRGGSGGGEAGGGANAALVSDEMKKELERQFGFDQPVWKQYYNWAIRDGLGMKMKSYEYPNRTAWELIRSRLPVSVWFGVISFLMSYLVCIPLGIAKALRHGSSFDFLSSIIVFSAYAVPAFAVGMILKMCLSGTVDGLWDIFPIGGFESDAAAAAGGWTLFCDRAYHMVLPVTAYVMTSFALLTIMMKNSLMEQMSADYVRTVLAKGATRRRAIWCHALRNALIPLATGFGGILGVLFAGSMIIETLFEIPGMGQLSLTALMSHDYAVFMAMLVMTASIQLFGNLISDFCYMLIDPRIHFD